MISDHYQEIDLSRVSDLDASNIALKNIVDFDPTIQDNLSKLNSEEKIVSFSESTDFLNSNRSSKSNLDNESNNLLSDDFSPNKDNINSFKNNFSSFDSCSVNRIGEKPKLVVNWKDEIYKGNFMPAFYLLDQKKINVDDIIDPNTQNRLLHLALSYNFTNVTRGLIEIFKCNLNIKNFFSHTPFHILCNNDQNDIFLFSYLIKSEDLLYDERDRTGVTPLFFSIISKQNLAFLLLLYKKANIYNIDEMGNNALYFCLSTDNKFALNFILRHSPKLTLNSKFYGNRASLSEVLISQKDRRITKHLIKFFHHKLELESIIASQKQKSQFNFYNNFNYDLFNTLYFYKTKNYIGFIGKLLSGNPISNYTYKYYNFKFIIYDLVLPNMNENLKYFLIGIYCFYISYLFFDFIKVSSMLNFNISLDLLSPKIFFLIYQTSSIICLYASLLKFFFGKTPKEKTCYYNKVCLGITTDNSPYYADEEGPQNNGVGINNPNSLPENIHNNEKRIKEPYYDYNNCNHNSDNCLNILYQAVERNPFDLFFEEEICEICLIKKNKNTNHCFVCNRCVKEFYFHSKFFNMCFHRKNIYQYILFYSSLMAIHFSFILFMVYKVSNDFSKANNPEKDFVDIPLSLYQSEYLLTNLITFLINLNLSGFLFVLISFILTVIFFQKWSVMLICVGYKVTYHNMFRMHKKAVGKIEPRKGKICNIPEVNTISICEFVKNLLKK